MCIVLKCLNSGENCYGKLWITHIIVHHLLNEKQNLWFLELGPVVFFSKIKKPSFALCIYNTYVLFIELPRISQQYSLDLDIIAVNKIQRSFHL